MEQQKDVDVAVAMVAEVKSKFAAQSACSFDKGFYSPNNRKQLGEILDQVVLPKKGKLSKTDKQIEYTDRNYDSPEAHYFSSKCIKQCP